MCLRNAISPFDEMLSYETLWGFQSWTLKTIAALFRRYQVLPSQLLDIVSKEFIAEFLRLRDEVRDFVLKLRGFSVNVHGTHQYPSKLRDAKYPLELFYYRGDIGYIESRCISVVGARKCSEEGRRRAGRLVRELVKRDFTIVSGLAAGIDTAAMTTAVEAKGRTIGVIGTPINRVYPRENSDLQEQVAAEHLLISQVPFYRYSVEPYAAHKLYFPQRNETMAALSEATVIVEASDTSGSLTQARACLQQGRKLFILNSCFERPDISWPATYERRGAIRVREIDDILTVLG